MKNYCTKCKKLTLYFLVLLSCVVVGYALVTQLLTITGTSNVTGSWDIKITNIKLNNTLSDGVENESASIDNAEKDDDGHNVSATFSVDLLHPGASAVFDVNIKNKGNINAILKSVEIVDDAVNTTGNPNVLNDISFACNAAADDLLNAGDDKDYTVTVTWDADGEVAPSETTSKTATVKFTYEQNT